MYECLYIQTIVLVICNLLYYFSELQNVRWVCGKALAGCEGH